MNTPNILCLGPVYVDVNCLSFPCDQGLKTGEEAVGADFEVVPGGSAVNFARFVHAFGIPAVLSGKVGIDPFSDLLVAMLVKDGLQVSLKPEPGAKTGVSMNFVSPHGASVMTTVGTATSTFTTRDLADILSEHASSVTHLYIGGALKLPQLIIQLESSVKHLRDQGVITILDHGRVPGGTSNDVLRSVRSLASAVDYYLPSRDEFLTVWDASDVGEAASRYLSSRAVPESILVVKNGSGGSIAYHGDEKLTTPGFFAGVKNTVGAGDSFNAGLIFAVTSGMSMDECLEFANAAAAVKISQSTPLSLAQVERFRAENTPNLT